MTANHVVLGTGAIGRAVMNELVKRGESVRMVNRSGKMDEVPAGVEVVAADLYDQAKVKVVTRGAMVVYQCSQPEYHQWTDKFPPLQSSIIEGLTGSNAKLVLVENLYMYGDPNGAPLTETSPHDAHTVKGRLRREMSRSALEAHREGRLKIAIGRGSDYFGPWGTESSAGGSIFRQLLAGKPAQIAGSANLPHTVTYIRDFAKALIILGERADADGQAWHVPNDMPQITQGGFVEMAAGEAGANPKVMAAGKFLLSALGLFNPAMKEIVEMLYEFEKPFIVDSSKFEKTFGMKATPMKEAIRETVAWYKSHPQKK